MDGRQCQNKHHGDTVPKKCATCFYVIFGSILKSEPGAVQFCRLRVDYLNQTKFLPSCSDFYPYGYKTALTDVQYCLLMVLIQWPFVATKQLAGRLQKITQKLRISLRTPSPPWISCMVTVHKIIMSKSIIPVGSISDKKDQCAKRESLKLFYENYCFQPIALFESAALEIAYNMKNRFLVIYYLCPLQTTECKNNPCVHSNRFLSNPK